VLTQAATAIIKASRIRVDMRSGNLLIIDTLIIGETPAGTHDGRQAENRIYVPIISSYRIFVSFSAIIIVPGPAERPVSAIYLRGKTQ
jgi:hypothetical protein